MYAAVVARTTTAPLDVPDWAWRRPEVRVALHDRDMGALLRSVQQYTGASQSRLAVAIGMLQGRVSEILRGHADGDRVGVVRADRGRVGHA